jgi:hypothetical protein
MQALNCMKETSIVFIEYREQMILFGNRLRLVAFENEQCTKVNVNNINIQHDIRWYSFKSVEIYH